MHRAACSGAALVNRDFGAEPEDNRQRAHENPDQ